MAPPIIAMVALIEALATASSVTHPKALWKQSRLLGPNRVEILRASAVGGGTVWSAGLLGRNDANRNDFAGVAAQVIYDTDIPYAAFANHNWLLRADASQKTGTVAVTAGSKTITGTGTAFTGAAAELQIGDEVTVNGQLVTIVAIASATVATADTNFLVTAAGVPLIVRESILRETSDYTLTNVGGMTRITLGAATKVVAKTKFSAHKVTPVALLNFATATVQHKKTEIAQGGYDVAWYASDATASPGSTSVYLEPIGA